MSNLTMDGNLAVVGGDSPEWIEIPSSSPFPRLGRNPFSPPGTGTLLLSPTPTSTQRTLDLSNINTNSSSPSTQSTNRDNSLSDNDPAPVVADSVVPPQPSTPVEVVSLEEWANAIQETKSKKSEDKDKPTAREMYPCIWKVVLKYFAHWKDENWAMVTKRVNTMEFKRGVVNWIVAIRRQKLTSDIIAEYKHPEFVQALGKHYNLSQANYLSLQTFEQYAVDTFKVDNTEHAEKMKPRTNDRLRLFHIAAHPDNRDALNNLGGGQNTSRSDADGALSRLDTIFSNWQTQFNDIRLTFTVPERAQYLSSFGDMDPNDPERIAITCDYTWLKKLWFDELKEYNRALTNWQLGTGGGPGMPENFKNWDTRDDEIFARYGKSGDRDDLAWIYMLDKKINFGFNTINDPAPAATVMEDGGSVSKRTAGVKRSSQALDAANSFGSILGESMKESISMMTNVLVREQQPAPGTHLETNKFSYLDNINKAMSVIERLDAQIETMKEKGASRRRIKILNGARERAYACLGDDKDAGSSSSDDDESSVEESQDLLR
jgi:hypothetical protein